MESTLILKLCHDNIRTIVSYLDKNDGLHLFQTCTHFHNMINIFYDEYIIDFVGLYSCYCTEKFNKFIPFDKIKNFTNINFIQPIHLFKNLQYVEFGILFNESIDDLPDNIEEIIMNNYYNQPINKLPNKLKSIKFGHNFNQIITNWPINLTILTYGFEFNQDIINWPINLKEVEFGDKFNKLITNWPLNLESIKFSSNNSMNYYINMSTTGIEYKIPNYIKKIYGIHQDWIEYLPDNIEKIACVYYGYKITKYPIKLKKILFKCICNQVDDDFFNNLPDNIEELFLDEDFNSTITKLPSKLKKLAFGNVFNKPINKLPETIISLQLGNAFNQCVGATNINKYPDNLQYIVFGEKFNQTIDNLPDSVEIIRLGVDFDQIIKKVPKQLRKIRFNYQYNKPLDALLKNLSDNHKENLTIYIHKIYPYILKEIPSNINIVFLEAKPYEYYKD